MAAQLKAWPHGTLTVPSAWAFDDYVVAEYAISGTFENDYVTATQHVKATKKPISVHGAIVAQMAGGKIAIAWDYANGAE
jgi:hypothetical protein